jgi:hypothetical protein
VIRRMLVAGAALGAVMALAAPAEAKKFVYSPIVEEGEKEIEYYVDWHEAAGEDVVAHELAYEWGFAPKDMIAIYGVWEAVSGEDPTFMQYQVEWIHQVFEQGERPWDFATYVEYQVRDKGDADKVEFKALLEKTLSRSTVTINGVFEKAIGEGAQDGTEAGYAARWALRRWPRVTPALEAYGEVGEITDMKDGDEQPHILGPVVDLQLAHGLSWQVGALFGLTDGSEDVRVKSQLAVEWY